MGEETIRVSSHAWTPRWRHPKVEKLNSTRGSASREASIEPAEGHPRVEARLGFCMKPGRADL